MVSKLCSQKHFYTTLTTTLFSKELLHLEKPKNIISSKSVLFLHPASNLSNCTKSLIRSISFSQSAFNETTITNCQFEENEITPFLKFDEALRNELESAPTNVLPTNSNQFSDYVNSSKILQSLVLLGVNLAEVQRKCPQSLKYLLQLDFNQDIKPKIQLLHAIGVTAQEFGSLLTKNMLLLDPKFSFNEIKENIDYLVSKKFTKKEISSIVTRYPKFLNVPFLKLDGILGFYQNLPSNYDRQPIRFSGNELRSIIVICPQLVAASLQDVCLVVKSLQMSCEFTRAQIRELVLYHPKILLMDLQKIEDLYKFWANEMNLTNDQIVKNCDLFNTRIKKTRNRHFYLKHLRKNIYDEHTPGYVSPANMAGGTDEDFCKKFSLGSLTDYELFLKTL